MYDSKIQEFQNVNGVRVYPITYEGTTYLPVGSISSIFGEQIKWVGETRSVYIGEGDLDTTSSKEIKNFIAGIDEEIEVLYDEDINVYYANEVQVFRDINQKRVYPLSYNGTTYLPVRAVANLFKVSIGWDGKNNAVLIGKKI